MQVTLNKKLTTSSQSYLTRVITGVTLAHPLENMVQSKDVAHLMDHGVVVTGRTKVRGVQHHPAWGKGDTELRV